MIAPEPRVAAAIGFRIKSGWAATVLLAEPAETPLLLDHRRIELSDPAVPRSRQPYHASIGKAQEDAAEVRRLSEIVKRCAERSVAALIAEYRDRGHAVRGAGLVVGSDVDPKSIRNPHIRAHAQEGWLFRTVVEQAVERAGLSCRVLRERNLYDTAARVLGKSDLSLKQEVSRLGRGSDGPWRAEGKTAAVAAWLALVEQDR